MTNYFAASALAAAIALPATAGAVTISAGSNTTDFGTFAANLSDVEDNRVFEFTADGDLTVNFAVAATGSGADLSRLTFGISFDSIDFDQANRSLNFANESVDPTSGTGAIDGVELADGRTLFFLFDGNGGIVNNASIVLDSVSASVSAVPIPASAPLLVAALAGLGFLSRKRKES